VTTVAEAVLTAFSGEPLSAPPSLPLSLEVHAMAGSRGADVVLLLVIIAAFYGVGRLMKSDSVKPSAVCAGLTAVFMLFFANSDFWSIAGVNVDDTGVTVTHWIGGDDDLPWDDLVFASIDSGKLFPAFTDDHALVLVGRDHKVTLPRFVPGIASAMPIIAQHLHY